MKVYIYLKLTGKNGLFLNLTGIITLENSDTVHCHFLKSTHNIRDAHQGSPNMKVGLMLYVIQEEICRSGKGNNGVNSVATYNT